MNHVLNNTFNFFTGGVLAPPGIKFISSGTGTNSIGTMPAHQAGDLLVVFAYRDGNTTAPSLVSGWTSLHSAGANSNSARVAYRVATSSSMTSGTWTNASSVICLVYRNATPGAVDVGGAVSTTVTYPALTLGVSDGSSWVACFAGHRSVNTALETPPTGTTLRATVVDATDEAAAFDTGGGVTSWTSKAVSVGGTSSGWRAYSLEIKLA